MSSCSEIIAEKDREIAALKAELSAAQDKALEMEQQRDQARSKLEDLRGEMRELAEHFAR